MKKLKKYFFFCLIILFSFPLPLLAANPLTMLREAAETSGPYEAAASNSIFIFLSNLVTVFLSLLGVIFLILIIVGGYNWMTASGDEQKYEKAKDTIYRAVIGLIITAAAYTISYFVFSKISENTIAEMPEQLSGPQGE